MRHDLQNPSPEISPRREEISSSFDLKVGRHVTLQGRASITPTGVLCAGLAVAAMTLALGHVAGSLRRRRD